MCVLIGSFMVRLFTIVLFSFSMCASANKGEKLIIVLFFDIYCILTI